MRASMESLQASEKKIKLDVQKNVDCQSCDFLASRPLYVY